ncbi:MAG: molybdenum cofactor guanylyltransferase [Roseicyclus sp.]|jgi:molybdopterin-guanine dinucleotide biosynthesis protein A|nr:molybdenum cofactor guanylyltransferase [Roseicyclus sp.]
MDQRAAVGVILAGGAGRRIGGDKAFVPLAGRPLLAHVIARLAPQCRALAINAAPDPRLAAFGLPVIPDGAEGGQGPLAGILAAMDWAAAQGAARVLTAPVDTPFLPEDLAARLSAVEAPIVLALTADGLHGTCGLWSVSLRDALAAALASGIRKVTEFTEAQGAASVPFPEGNPPPFLNVNRPEDLAKAETALAGT